MIHDDIALIPMSALTGEGEAYYPALTGEGPLQYSEWETFFCGFEEIVNRWYQVAGNLCPGIYAQYHTHIGLVRDMRAQFFRVEESDDESFVIERAMLNDLLYAIDTMIDKLAGAFEGPSELCRFYFNLSSRARATFEELIGGDCSGH